MLTVPPQLPNPSNNHCQSPQLGSQISSPSAIEHKYDKRWIKNWPSPGIELSSSRLITNGHNHYTQMLLGKVITFYIPIHNVLEQPCRNFTSLKLCKCSQIPHPSTEYHQPSIVYHRKEILLYWIKFIPRWCFLRVFLITTFFYISRLVFSDLSHNIGQSAPSLIALINTRNLTFTQRPHFAW